MDTTPQTTEIHMTLLSMMNGVLVIGALVVAAHLLVHRNDHAEMQRTIAVLCISLSFYVAQHDHKIFRLGHWVKQVETQTRQNVEPADITPWETHKAALKSRTRLMPVLDAGMAVAPLYVLVRTGMAAWSTQPVFLLWSFVGIGLGVFMIWVGQKLAGW